MTSCGNDSVKQSAPNSKSLTSEQNREVKAAMSSPSVAKCLSMGIPKDAIETAIRERLIVGKGKYLPKVGCKQYRSFAYLISNIFQIDIKLSHHSGHFRDDESLILAALLVNDHPTPNISSPKDAKLNEGPRLPKIEKATSPVVAMITCSNNMAAKSLNGNNMEQKENMDNFLNFVDAKSLKDENQRLKEEKLCKVLVKGSTATAKSEDGYLICSFMQSS